MTPLIVAAGRRVDPDDERRERRAVGSGPRLTGRAVGVHPDADVRVASDHLDGLQHLTLDVDAVDGEPRHDPGRRVDPVDHLGAEDPDDRRLGVAHGELAAADGVRRRGQQGLIVSVTGSISRRPHPTWNPSGSFHWASMNRRPAASIVDLVGPRSTTPSTGPAATTVPLPSMRTNVAAGDHRAWTLANATADEPSLNGSLIRVLGYSAVCSNARRPTAAWWSTSSSWGPPGSSRPAPSSARRRRVDAGTVAVAGVASISGGGPSSSATCPAPRSRRPRSASPSPPLPPPPSVVFDASGPPPPPWGSPRQPKGKPPLESA